MRQLISAGLLMSVVGLTISFVSDLSMEIIVIANTKVHVNILLNCHMSCIYRASSHHCVLAIFNEDQL